MAGTPRAWLAHLAPVRGVSPFYGSGTAAPFNGSGTAAPSMVGGADAVPISVSEWSTFFCGSGVAAFVLLISET